MGEIADMMLEGDLCEGCGMALDGEGYGVPRYCSNGCAQDRGFDGVAKDGTGKYFSKKPIKKKLKFADAKHELVIKVTYGGQALVRSVTHDVDIKLALEVGTDLKDRLIDYKLENKIGPLLKEE